jgi:hypothetical protein
VPISAAARSLRADLAPRRETSSCRYRCRSRRLCSCVTWRVP